MVQYKRKGTIKDKGIVFDWEWRPNPMKWEMNLPDKVKMQINKISSATENVQARDNCGTDVIDYLSYSTLLSIISCITLRTPVC